MKFALPLLFVHTHVVHLQAEFQTLFSICVGLYRQPLRVKSKYDCLLNQIMHKKHTECVISYLANQFICFLFLCRGGSRQYRGKVENLNA